MQGYKQKAEDALSLVRTKKRLRIAALFFGIAIFLFATYVLILPAITLNPTVCGLKEHIHTESCYEIKTEPVCQYENPEISADEEETTAEESNIEETTEIIEEIEETSGETQLSEISETTDISADEDESETELIEVSEEYHVHSEECYIIKRMLICPETEHSHTDECFEEETTEEQTSVEESSSEDESTSDDINNGNISFLGGVSEEYPVQPLAEGEIVQKVNFDTLDGSGNTRYVVYTYYNGQYYAFDGNGNAVQVTVNGNTLTSTQMGNNLYWKFTRQSNGENVYRIINVGTNKCMHTYYNSNTNTGVTTGNSYDTTLIPSGNGSSKTFAVFCNNKDYTEIATSGNRVIFRRTADSSKAAQFYIAEIYVPQSSYHVWFDGTCGGLMSLYEAGNVYQNVPGSNPVITLPVTCKSPSKYDYTLNGWYDIKNHKYYKPGDRVTITKDTVFYADWVAKTYDVGQYSEHVVASLDTNSFIKTNMFDYSAVFNFQSVTHTGSVSATGHDETWSIVQNNNVPYNNAPSLGFIFRDWDSANKHISYGANRARLNDNQGTVITSQIIDYVYDMSGKDIIDILFNPNTNVIGKTHVGEANYLYQFMEEGSPNYDGIHNGYYYYDATKNAASYNQTEKRFYIYDYLERTSDSYKDGFDANGNPTAEGSYSDFLPFNSPYANNSNNKKIVNYVGPDGKDGNYQYDAKATNQQSAAGNAGTNYWFGMKSEIHFYLPNNTGEKDAYNNYGNISTHGDHMTFEFHGDDDLWVFIDGELVMDVGGLHGIMEGTIDFSTGTIRTDAARNNSNTETPTERSFSLAEGDHTLTIYYMERGGSQSNCAIYFNIAPRYKMEIEKFDALSGEPLDGAQFSVYTDEACSQNAQLWNSEAEYNLGAASSNVFSAVNGKVSFWGISPGKTYYIKETKAPDGYPATDDIVRVAMNNLGGVVCTTDSLRGENEEHTDGFDILDTVTDEGIHLLYVRLTNQKPKENEAELKNIRASKVWATGSTDIPESITLQLTANGTLTDKIAVLNASNGWTYTWTELPPKDDNNIEIEYGVKEILVPGFTSQYNYSDFDDRNSWILEDAFRDGDTFLIVNKSENKALSVNRNNFAWIDIEAAKTNVAAQWTSIADGMGFHLINGNNQMIVLNENSKFVPSTTGNKVLYFFNSRLFAQYGNTAYYFSTNAAANSQSGLQLELYKKNIDGISGDLVEITNTPIPTALQTYLNVTKAWTDGNAQHLNGSVTFELYADGEYTGSELTLNSSNNWSGTFDRLSYLNDDGQAVVYTVKEKEIEGYLPEYSYEVVLTSGNIYRFTDGGFALSADSNGNVIKAVDDPADTYQQWKVVVQSGTTMLQNVRHGGYLQYRSSRFSLASSPSTTNCSVAFSYGVLCLRNSYYIMFNQTAVGSTSVKDNATDLTATVKTQNSERFGSAVSVANRRASFRLPETGGSGTYHIYAIGMLLVTVCSLTLYRRKKKTGKYVNLNL